MDMPGKLAVLSAAAKFDASCSSSGSARKAAPGGLGNGAVAGICHSWAADGRCVSLLKVLLSNACAYDCAYCVNRRSNDVVRAGFEPEELVRLVMDFYRRNYIEGVFLSSAVAGCPDSTMERLVAVARTLRRRERWNGYLHLKAIPGASERLVMEAAALADRVSVNIELPSAASLALVAPDKTPASIFGVMRTLSRASGFEPRRLTGAGSSRSALPAAGSRTAAGSPEALPSAAASDAAGASEARASGSGSRPSSSSMASAAGTPALPIAGSPAWSDLPAVETAAAEPRPLYDAGASDPRASSMPAKTARPSDRASPSRTAEPSVMAARTTRERHPEAAVLPAGQTTQLVVGASPESDAAILTLAENLYLAYDVRRVYYSAFVPAGADPRVPALPGPPLLREHRLYQADWLFRFYGFKADEILDDGRPFLDDVLDPKCAWALRHLERFPVEVNDADYLELLRVPGIGPRSASRIVAARRQARLSEKSLRALGVVLKRAAFFITCSGRRVEYDGASRTRRVDPGLARAALDDGARAALSGRQLELDWREDEP